MWTRALLILMFAACKGADWDCCASGDGWTWVARGTCPSGDRAARVVCEEEIGDPDAIAAPEQLCQDYCAALAAVCPGDDSCLESCEQHATTPVSQEAVDCAAAAPDCPSTGACWDMLGL